MTTPSWNWPVGYTTYVALIGELSLGVNLDIVYYISSRPIFLNQFTGYGKPTGYAAEFLRFPCLTWLGIGFGL